MHKEIKLKSIADSTDELIIVKSDDEISICISGHSSFWKVVVKNDDFIDAISTLTEGNSRSGSGGMQEGWIQCSQCGNGSWIYRYEVDIGDIHDRQPCDLCGTGIMTITWDMK